MFCIYHCIHLLLFVCQVYNGSYDAPYVNPKAPVHFISGAPVSRSQWLCAVVAEMHTYIVTSSGSVAEMNIKSNSDTNIS